MEREGSGPRAAQAGAGRGEPGAALLPIYLREMGATPLLDREQEVELSRELHEARVALVQLARKLPLRCREQVLDRGPSGTSRSWTLARLDLFHERLVGYARDRRDPVVVRLAARAVEIKGRIDRARDGLILANLRLVAHIAKKHANHGIPFMDLIQEGNIGLMKAVEKFDHQRGNKFSTYAYWWIKQAITRAIADKARTIRVPVHVTEKMKRILRASAELAEELGRKPRPQEIARKLRLPTAKVIEILNVVQDAQSFDEIGEAEESGGLLQVVADPAARSPFDNVAARELREQVGRSLGLLEPREREIIRLRYGIDHDAPLTLDDIGRKVRLSRERVRQIEDAALRKIQRGRASRPLVQQHQVR